MFFKKLFKPKTNKKEDRNEINHPTVISNPKPYHDNAIQYCTHCAGRKKFVDVITAYMTTEHLKLVCLLEGGHYVDGEIVAVCSDNFEVYGGFIVKTNNKYSFYKLTNRIKRVKFGETVFHVKFICELNSISEFFNSDPDNFAEWISWADGKEIDFISMQYYKNVVSAMILTAHHDHIQNVRQLIVAVENSIINADNFITTVYKDSDYSLFDRIDEINFNHFKSKYINNEITDLVIRPGEIEVWVA